MFLLALRLGLRAAFSFWHGPECCHESQTGGLSTARHRTIPNLCTFSLFRPCRPLHLNHTPVRCMYRLLQLVDFRELSLLPPQLRNWGCRADQWGESVLSFPWRKS